MKVEKAALIFFFLASWPGNSLGTNIVAPTKAEVEAMYAAAARELNAGNYSATLQKLDALDERQPEVAAAKNLRGVVLMRMGEYGRAEKALRKARELDPNFWEARFNLAEVPFLQKNWAVARDRFAALAKEPNEQAQGATADLIQFKILLTYLLEGKEKPAREIVERLTNSSVSLAGYYAKAALAFRHKDETEARVNLRAAEKSFSERFNQLFRESFYEVGWMEKTEGAPPVALEVSSPAEQVASAQAAFGKAEHAYRQGDLEQAWRLLDEVDASAPNQAVSYNLRGKILLERGKEKEAEEALRSALVADPQLQDARYNLARIPLRKHDYEAARKQLEELLGATSGGKEQRRREQLIRYNIFLTLLLEGRDGPAQKAMDEFKMMDDTPALYYAQAAWAFQHGNGKQAGNWVANAGNLFSPELNRSFATPLADLGWLGKSPTVEPVPSTVTLTKPSPPLRGEAAPANPIPSATPENQPRETPAPVIAEKSPITPSPSASPEASVSKKKVATRKGKKSNRDEDEEESKRAKKKRVARSKAEPNEEESSRSKRIRIEKAKPVASLSPTPTPAAQVEPTPPRQNLGDKIRRFFLYPFKRPNDKQTNPAVTPPIPSASATPTPTIERRRN